MPEQHHALTSVPQPEIMPDPPGVARMLEVIFPGNTNSLGSAFGGHVLSLMDKAAAFAAGRYALTPVVTAMIDRVDFRVPVKVGDVVELIACVQSVGRTSMQVRVDVFKEERATREHTVATSGHFVMVSIGPDGKPAPVRRPEALQAPANP